MNQPDPAAKASAGEKTSSPGPRKMAVGLEYLGSVLGPLVGLLCVIAFFGITDYLVADGTFFSFRNLRTVTVQSCVVAVASLGMTVIIIAGGIDLSAGTAVALCATTLAWGLREDAAFLWRHGDNYKGATVKLESARRELTSALRKKENAVAARWEAEIALRRDRLQAIVGLKRDAAQLRGESGEVQRLQQRLEHLSDPVFLPESDPQWLSGVSNAPATSWLAVLLCVLTGLACGLANGALISWLWLVPFIVTLGTMTIFLGLGNLLSDNVPIRPDVQTQIPSVIRGIASNAEQAQWFGLFPTGVWLAVVLAVLLALVLRYSIFGRHVFALGSSESTARLCGINVPANKIAVYALGGVFFSLAGMYQFSKLNTGNPMSGVGLELQIIAAVVIGGGSLSGGRGTVLGTLAGVGIMAVISSGCTQLGLADSSQRIILGMIIIGAVTIDQFRQRRRGED